MAATDYDTLRRKASGNLGQRVYIIPSHRLVIARLGVTQWPDYDIRGDNRFIRAVIAALPRVPPPTCARSQVRS